MFKNFYKELSTGKKAGIIIGSIGSVTGITVTVHGYIRNKKERKKQEKFEKIRRVATDPMDYIDRFINERY